VHPQEIENGTAPKRTVDSDMHGHPLLLHGRGRLIPHLLHAAHLFKAVLFLQTPQESDGPVFPLTKSSDMFYPQLRALTSL
jgi:hypothetical protein